MVLSAKRIDAATQGFSDGMVDFIANEQDLLAKTIEHALKVAPFSVDKENHKKIKEEMNRYAINACLNMQMAPGVRGEYGLPKPKL